MSDHVVQWVTASPLWPSTLDGADEVKRRETMQRPALLRFERDSFMDDVGRLLDRKPEQLVDHVATPVTYRLPSPGESEPPVPAADDLKLFQAVHGHFYLVAATLTCRRPGLPEHEVNTSLKERVVFVLRRVDDGGDGEWAWVDDPDGKNGKSWKHLDKSEAAEIDAEEELLPLFPLRYTVNERLRRLYVGLIPTASGDAFKAAGPLSPLAKYDETRKGSPSKDPRPDALTAKVTNALRLLMATETDAPAGAKNPDQIKDAMKQQQKEASRFLLLDFAEFLHDTMGWFASGSWSAPTRAEELALWSTLATTPAVSSGTISWSDALKTAWSERLVLSGDAPGPSSLDLNLRTPGLTPDQLDADVGAALPQPYTAAASGTATSIQGDTAPPPAVPKLDARSKSKYVLRCVYRRPECKPPHPDVVSNPSQPFRIASFFDFDAPARSITIAMPVDTGIKDLRKLPKNVNFLLSNELRSQMNRVTNMKDAMAGQFADGESLDIGLLCSFSIPVITICALMVLMIFISLLNIVFWWMPFLRICFPIALEAKK